MNVDPRKILIGCSLLMFILGAAIVGSIWLLNNPIHEHNHSHSVTLDDTNSDEASHYYGPNFPRAARSGKWPTVRKHYLEAHPSCAACGKSDSLEVHHRRPFHDAPDKELDPDNLITLCRRCHRLIGHLDNWHSYNPNVGKDAERTLQEIKSRPE